MTSSYKKATFAGGCFWGMEELFKDLSGVIETKVGYTGGENEDPTYENHPGHAEALEIDRNDYMTRAIQRVTREVQTTIRNPM